MNNYFCVLPFFGAEYTPLGLQSACCLLPKNTDIAKIRQLMLAGQRPHECNKCWILENQGLTSDRQLKNSSFDFYADRDISLIEQDCKEGKYSQQIIKIYTSNLCNSTCFSCNPQYSTAWAAIKNIPIHLNKMSQADIPEHVYHNMTMLSFVGGEPFYEKENFKILERLIEYNKTDCFISIVTNGSTSLSNIQQDILSKFKNLNITISIDGIGPVFEYLRFPLKWGDLLNNLNTFKNITNNISVSYTISNLNAIYYAETIQWFNDNHLNYNYNLVTNPDYLNINVLPESVKKLYSEIQPLLSDHPANYNDLFEKLKQEIASQDKLKNISITDYLPLFYSLIQ
jgi:hypothetical protein